MTELVERLTRLGKQWDFNRTTKMDDYVSKDGTVYSLPEDSYGAIGAASNDRDLEGLAMLLEKLPYEWTGRRDAMVSAAADGDLEILRLVLEHHEGEEISAFHLAWGNGHAEAASMIWDRMSALDTLDHLNEDYVRSDFYKGYDTSWQALAVAREVMAEVKRRKPWTQFKYRPYVYGFEWFGTDGVVTWEIITRNNYGQWCVIVFTDGPDQESMSCTVPEQVPDAKSLVDYLFAERQIDIDNGELWWFLSQPMGSWND